MNIAFRVDASPLTGSGHVMRCLCLADALRVRGATVRIVTRHLPPALGETLAARGHEVIAIGSPADPPAADDLAHASWLGTTQAADAAATAAALAPQMWDWLVVDHYALDARWETSLRRHARRILAIDDLANRPHDCDALLDQNLHADSAGRYAGRVPDTCQLLLGPAYALVRDEFTRVRDRARRTAEDVVRVLVSFGGVDAGNLTGAGIAALLQVGVTAADVVIGADHPQRAAIEAECRRLGFTCHVQSSRLAELMAAADLAIGAGGITTWERCCVGLPALAVAVADNQRGVIEEAARQGLLYTFRGEPTAATLALHLRALLDNPRLRELLARRGMETVDGRGADRVARALDQASIEIRQATAADAADLFAWRSHDSVRRASRHDGPIEWSDHQAWLNRVLTDADRLLLIGERGGTPIGVVRFDVRTPDAEVSIYRVPASPGRGLAGSLLLAAEAWLRQRRPDVATLTAEVLAGNEPSHQLFDAAGYRRRSMTYVKPMQAA